MQIENCKLKNGLQRKLPFILQFSICTFQFAISPFLRGVGRSLRGLIRAWWDVDRVRISPREGKLLGLVPPCVIRVQGEPFEIMNRIEQANHKSSDEETAAVHYDCRGSERSARLLVTWTG